MREAYASEFAATIERAEKHIILAKHGQRLLELLDDSPVVPGDTRTSYGHGAQARQILNDAEDDLRDWQPEAPSFGTPVQSPRLKTEKEFNTGEPAVPTEEVAKTPEASGALGMTTSESSRSVDVA